MVSEMPCSQKMNFVAVNIFTGEKMFADVIPAEQTMAVPVIRKNTYQLLDIGVPDKVTGRRPLCLLDDATNTVCDELSLPNDEALAQRLVNDFQSGVEVHVEVTSAMGQHQVTGIASG